MAEARRIGGVTRDESWTTARGKAISPRRGGWGGGGGNRTFEGGVLEDRLFSRVGHFGVWWREEKGGETDGAAPLDVFAGKIGAR